MGAPGLSEAWDVVVGRIGVYAFLHCFHDQRGDHHSDRHDKTTQAHHTRLTFLLMSCSTCFESALAQCVSGSTRADATPIYDRSSDVTCAA